MNLHAELMELSRLINENVEDNFLLYEKGSIENHWLGYQPATLEMIKEKESELGVKLSKSYKEFLSK